MVTQTEFRRALKSNELEIIKEALKNGFGVNHQFTKGWTPLHLAVKYGQTAIVRFLLEQKADVNAETEAWETPLDQAIQFQQKISADLIRDLGGKQGVESSVHGATYGGNLNWLKKHIAGGADINAKRRGQLPLCIALEVRRWPIAEFLLKQKADVTKVDEHGDTALHVAAANGAEESILRKILKLGADINAVNHEDSYTPLCRAARAGDEFMAQFLVKHGAKANYHSKDGSSPLRAALWNSERAVARVLIDLGAKPTFHQAIDCGHMGAIQQKLREGVSVDATEKDSEDTPLLRAVINEFPDVVELLLENKADPNAQGSYNGETPLHWAIYRSSPRMVKALLAHGANPDAHNKSLLTPFEAAKQRGLSSLVRLMENQVDRQLAAKAVEQLYSVQQLAELLSVDVAFVTNLVDTGKLKVIRLDPNTVRIPHSSVARYYTGLQK